VETLIFIIIIFLLITVVGGLVKINWNDNAKTKLNSLRKERIFWELANGYEGIIFDIKAIFTIYLDQRLLVNFITGVKERTEDDNEILKLLNKKRDTENINVINDAIEDRNNNIVKILNANQQLITKNEVVRVFENHKEEQILVPEQYDRFVKYFLQTLRGDSIKLTDVWDVRLKLEDNSTELEWKSDENKVEPETLFILKKSQEEVGEVVIKLLCQKISDEKTTNVLRKNLEQWEKLHMLRWCIVDYSVDWIGTNGIQRTLWGILGNFA